MARVCKEWYPKGTYKHQKGDGFYMDDNLKQQLEILARNIINDWDFTIIITGGGEVRVGKSVLGLQIMAYWSYLIEKYHGIKVPFSVKENIVLNWDKLIEQGHKLSKKSHYCAISYDEAGETMEGTKTNTRELKAVRDYLRECGQYNFLNILVLPEFFTLPRGIALTRSIFLIDVYYSANQEGIFERGYFKFYSRRNKKLLYLRGRKELEYNAYHCNFQGRFYPFYPVDEIEYRKLKEEALRNRAANVRDIVSDTRDTLYYILNKQFSLSHQKISDKIKELTGTTIPRRTITDAIDRFTKALGE